MCILFSNIDNKCFIFQMERNSKKYRISYSKKPVLENEVSSKIEPKCNLK